MSASPRPLDGLRVLDFSTLLPGPMCSLLLAEAGADVVKIERPGQGDEMRSYAVKFGPDSVNFALLNRGKRSMALDLKNAADRDVALGMVDNADVLVEQFRPGVMAHLGLGAETLLTRNPRLVYCSITGYGQTGPLAQVAAHDLNYLAEAGMLSLCAGVDGTPGLPPTLIADLAGGAYPAVMNILLALRQRESTNRGTVLDVSMADNLFPLMYWGLGNGLVAGQWPAAGGELVTGGTPRYQVYRTADNRYLAVAALEQKFWETLLQIVDAPELLDDASDPRGVRVALARLILSRTAQEWERRFDGRDVCVAVVRTVAEAVDHPHFKARGLFDHRLTTPDGRQTMPALPVPVDPAFRHAETVGYPGLDGEPRTIL